MSSSLHREDQVKSDLDSCRPLHEDRSFNRLISSFYNSTESKGRSSGSIVTTYRSSRAQINLDELRDQVSIRVLPSPLTRTSTEGVGSDGPDVVTPVVEGTVRVSHDPKTSVDSKSIWSSLVSGSLPTSLRKPPEEYVVCVRISEL